MYFKYTFTIRIHLSYFFFYTQYHVVKFKFDSVDLTLIDKGENHLVMQCDKMFHSTIIMMVPREII